MKKILFFLIIILFSSKAWSQPGEGGGGLVIHRVYDQNLKPISKLNPNLNIRVFTLYNGNFWEMYTKDKFQNPFESEEQIHNEESTIIYLEPYFDPVNFSPNWQSTAASNQRVFITYLKDTMLIDFVGIMGINSQFSGDFFDSLVFMKGNYSISLYDFKHNWNDTIKVWFRNGITKNTLVKHFLKGSMSRPEKIDMSFLEKQNRLPILLNRRAAFLISIKKLDSAIAVLKKSISIIPESYETYLAKEMLANVFDELGKYKEELELVDDRVKASMDRTSISKRIELYIKMNLLDLALSDYDKLLMLYDKIEIMTERALFKSKYMKDNKSAMLDLHAIIDTINPRQFNGCMQCRADYINSYYALATIEYRANKTKDAINHWLFVQELGVSGHGYYLMPKPNYDTLIRMHPKNGELYLARAISNIIISKNAFGKPNENTYVNIISDIDKAHLLGIKDYRINEYKAIMFHYLGKYDDAIVEIDKAISLNPNNPLLFKIKSDIRYGSGYPEYSKRTDADYRKRNELCVAPSKESEQVKTDKKVEEKKENVKVEEKKEEKKQIDTTGKIPIHKADEKVIVHKQEAELIQLAFTIKNKNGEYIKPICKVEIIVRENGLNEMLVVSNNAIDTVSRHKLIYAHFNDKELIKFQFTPIALREISITIYYDNDSMAVWFFPQYSIEYGAIPVSFSPFEINFVPNNLLTWRGYKIDANKKPIFNESKMMYGGLKKCECYYDIYGSRPDTTFSKTDDKPFTGTCYKYYGNKKNIHTEFYYKNGVMTGSTSFHYSGEKYRNEYVSGYDSARREILNGDSYEWYPNGQLEEYEFYKNGIPLFGREWYENGKLKKEYRNSKIVSKHDSKGIHFSSIINTIEYVWFANGKLQTKKETKYYGKEEMYKNFKGHSKQTRYYDITGRLRGVTWSVGRQEKKEINYYANGKKRSKTIYHFKDSTYKTTEWDEKGKKKVYRYKKRNPLG